MEKEYKVDFVPEDSQLTFIELSYVKDKHKYALYKCSCGKEKIIKLTYARKGRSKSCGCRMFGNDKKTKKIKPQNPIKSNSLIKHPLYSVWKNIKSRCYNKNISNYSRYGGRGITMCDEWKNDFKAFYDWAIENGWKEGMQIDKDKKPKELGIPVTIYSPEMCSVLTLKQNMNARDSNHFVEFNGIKQTIAQWAEEYNINQILLLIRIRKGWDFKKALLSPKISTLETGIKRRKIILNTETGIFYFGVKEAADSIGQTRNTVEHKMCGSKRNNTPLRYV